MMSCKFYSVSNPTYVNQIFKAYLTIEDLYLMLQVHMCLIMIHGDKRRKRGLGKESRRYGLEGSFLFNFKDPSPFIRFM